MLGLTMNQVFTDIYLEGIAPNVSNGVRRWTEVPWYVFWTFQWTTMPHEFGHWARARQSGGDFVYSGYNVPIPEAQMRLPQPVALEYDALASVGGFEINNLMRRRTTTKYYMTGSEHPN
jgi:hypothetical protein